MDAFRADTMKQLEKSLQASPRPLIEAALGMARDQLETEAVDGGFTKVVFPAMFRNLVVIVGRIDGARYLVRMPGVDR